MGKPPRGRDGLPDGGSVIIAALVGGIDTAEPQAEEAAINAAETGHLVFCTIHASSAPSTIGRILDLFPADMHGAMRQSLAFNLKAIICQKLLPGLKPGVQRVPTNEIMMVNATIRCRATPTTAPCGCRT